MEDLPQNIDNESIVLRERLDGVLIIKGPSQKKLDEILKFGSAIDKQFIEIAFRRRDQTNSIALKSAAESTGINLEEALKTLYPGISDDIISKIIFVSSEESDVIELMRGAVRGITGIYDVGQGKCKK
ncbi:MAG: hypothetical protein UR28_C0033G0021 [Candidatus Peregrinibacteria bacterium GW2011_GWF2_33_10]|nr:MAG: hypothetical protein UR28_C0033G0021 [Candidatus Peregrinibacteria bacterium GW2011_GWF2_33_10]OGJ44335.1 MAG: hypothetical protein A2272_05680 [Candidatus Peregrinibacteria bacterium RIFOXYA12_FULL_33_12]OGJ44463.1 MAG: hypothetical protein A2263_00270 [Candidatus Peregrinibacteria bacterium RIFOXYA2_FULL_33_21]OGJ50213.1 MAG: hypothetical protein A2307_06525 [Candidatus Peregrinibacteria bacterium RIFOXYB2_FULL_33_20]